MQWTGWPDQKSPSENDYNIIQKLLDRMMTFYFEKENKKALIHCR